MCDVLLSVDWIYSRLTIASLYYVWRVAVCWLNLFMCYHRVFILCVTCCCLLIESIHVLPSRLYSMYDVLLSVDLFTCYHRVFILCVTCCCLLIESIHVLPSRLYIMCDVLLSVDWIYSRVTIASLYYVWRAAVCWLHLFTSYNGVFILCVTCCCLLIESVHVFTIASLYYVWRAAVCWLNLFT